MQRISALNAGFAVGLFTGLFHAAWAALVAAGWAQALIDFVLRLHFIKPMFEIQPFSLGTAAFLVGLTTGVGFVLGFILALLWNWVVRRQPAIEPSAARHA